MEKTKKPAAAPRKPCSFSNLSGDLKAAIRDINLAQTQAALKSLQPLKQTNQDELKCLHQEAKNMAQASMEHQARLSRNVAKYVAKARLQRIMSHTPCDLKTLNAESELATLNHANAITIYESVTDFFIEEWHEQSLFALPQAQL